MQNFNVVLDLITADLTPNTQNLLQYILLTNIMSIRCISFLQVRNFIAPRWVPKNFNTCFSNYRSVSIIPLTFQVERFSYFLDKVV